MTPTTALRSHDSNKSTHSRIAPEEAIAIALTVTLGKHIGPQSQAVKLSLSALEQCGFKIVRGGQP
jgi:hypothetical protein